ncbi:MAG: SDR family NAD-dependent epimerase/dehydratase, partial [Candidatus Kapaibacterium sp.]
LIEGIVRLLNAPTHEPVNVGNPDEVSMLRLAEEIRMLSKSASPIEFRDLPQDDPKVRQPDISRAQSLLKWEPKVQRAEGLERTYAYFLEKLSAHR